MNSKYLQNNLVYRVLRDEQYQKMLRRVQSIRNSPGRLNHEKLALSLPKIAQKIPLLEPKFKIQRENEQLVERIVQATQRSVLRELRTDKNVDFSMQNCRSDRSERQNCKTAFKIPKDYYFKKEEQRRIQIENQRLVKVISTRRKKKLF